MCKFISNGLRESVLFIIFHRSVHSLQAHASHVNSTWGKGRRNKMQSAISFGKEMIWYLRMCSSDIVLSPIWPPRGYVAFLPLLPSHHAGFGSTYLPAFACFVFFSKSPQIKIDELSVGERGLNWSSNPSPQISEILTLSSSPRDVGGGSIAFTPKITQSFRQTLEH